MFSAKPHLAVILGTAALLVGVAGCGGGDAEPQPTTTPTVKETTLTKSELISQANGLCAEVNAAIGSIQSSTTVAESSKADQIGDLYDGLAGRIEKLGTPDDAPAPEAVISALRALGAGTATNGTADLVDAATQYGLTDCAAAPAAPIATTEPSGEPSEGYEEPAPTTTPEPEPAPAPQTGTDNGGVGPETQTGGTAAPTGETGGGGTGTGTGSGSGGASGGSTGGIGPG